MLGFLAALAVHESTFTASTLSPDNPLFWAMHAGIFPLFFPMVFGLRKWSETRTGAFGISTRRLRWRAILPYLPQWAIAVGAVLFVYALINFVLAMKHMPPRGPVGAGTRTMDPEQARNLVRAFSGHWLLFYAIPTLYFLFVPSAPRTDSGGRASG